MNNVPFNEKLLFTRNLAIMLKSGIPILEALATLREQTGNYLMKRMLSRIEKEVTNGQSLSAALGKYRKVFDAFYVNLIEIGEKSGNLENNLAYLAEGLKKDYEFRQKVTGASIYPATVFVTSLIVGGGVSYFVLPNLIEIFRPFDVELPLSTRTLLWFATVMRDHGLLIFASFVAVIVGLWLLYLIKPVRFVWQKSVLYLPLFGNFSVNIQMTYFCRNLGIMLRSGLPIFEALSSLRDATGNLVFRSYVASLAKSVEQGVSLSDAMIKRDMKKAPRMAIKMVAVADKSGKLDETLLYLANYFEEEVEHTAKVFANVMEPAMLLVVGFIVAFVAFAIVSPIYRFTGSIGK